MAIDPSSFYLHNITDTCAVLNVLSSTRLYNVARRQGVRFYCTNFVIYECLYKPVKTCTVETDIIRSRLQEVMQNDFLKHSIDLEDLQSIEILSNRQHLGKGELSSMVFAKKINQPFLTDDQKARKLACHIEICVQTTPHLLSWLFYGGYLLDGDMQDICDEHKKHRRPLVTHFYDAYQMAMEYKLKNNVTQNYFP